VPSRALVIDDDPGGVVLIQNVLTGAGIDSLVLTASAEAAGLLLGEKFAIAIFGIQMPAPDGLELARLVRKSGINQMTPIVLMSDDPSPGATAKGFAAGASFFLYKPIDKAHLLALVRATQGLIEQERRRFRRVPLQARVHIACDKDEWDCETIDVSLNGILVHAPVALQPGSSVRVSLFIAPNGKPIVARGSVVRLLSGNRMGIQLTQIALHENARLQEFLLPMILLDDQPASPVSV
jgi:DNA-binding response OmpR family regulator